MRTPSVREPARVQVRVPEQVQVLQIQEPAQVQVQGLPQPVQVQQVPVLLQQGQVLRALKLRELPAAIKMRHRFRIRRKTSEDP